MCKPTDGRKHESEEGEEGENVDWRLCLWVTFSSPINLYNISKPASFFPPGAGGVTLSVFVHFLPKGLFGNGTSVVLRLTFVDTAIDPLL